MTDRIRVYFTIDTETSMGGAWRNAGPGPLPVDRTIFGEYGSRSYGVPLIMDMLEEHGFRGTFFIEVFCSYLLGQDQVSRVFRTIQDRGHDAQLHLHPVYRFYRDFLQGKPRRERDLMWQLEPDEQRQLIGEGVKLFHEFAGRAPKAFRAGCYGASEVTLQALRECGIAIDSSYNLSYLDSSCGFTTRPLNAPQLLRGVHEYPVTNFTVGVAGTYKPLEISAVSVAEILTTIRALHKAGCRDAVLVFHSFSFLKRRGVRFENCRPDHIVIRRFRSLCKELAGMREVEVAVLGNADVSQDPPPQSHLVPSVGWVLPVVRKAVQGVDYIPWI